MLKPVDTENNIKATLAGIVGESHLVEETETRELFSQDVYKAAAHVTSLIVAPNNTDELSRALAATTKAGHAAIPRGAGMSYTGGYLPQDAQTITFDMQRMSRILDINETDMTVTVEAGCTWKDLYEALKEKNLRTPFWGPLSGLTSTIGGGLSQGNAFFGASQYGTTAESLVCLKVVLADGTVIETGSAGTKTGDAFYRHYGPDLAGIFMGDTGAYGFKAEATFRLIPYPAAEDWASFEFDTLENLTAATSALARAGIGCELFGFDPNLQRVRMKRASLMADVKSLANVVKGQKNILSGVKEAAKIAVAGRDFIDDAAYSIHLVVEGRSQAAVDEDMKTARAILAEHDAKEIENTIPKVIRSTPFAPLNTIIGPQGERWVPVHGIVPHSKATSTWQAIDKMFAEEFGGGFEKYEITTGYLITTLSTNGFLIEPVFLWPEQLDAIHHATVEKSILSKVKGFNANPEATEIVAKARARVADIFYENGATHFQIGKGTYRYKDGRKPESWALLEGIKNLVDPDRRINPGSLGLD
jgi:FAD/FMN-containing dehydrogenase